MHPLGKRNGEDGGGGRAVIITEEADPRNIGEIGMVWCGMVWYAMIWLGMVWCGNGMVW